MWWEISADKERGQSGVTTWNHILGVSRIEEILKAASAEGAETWVVPRTAHGSSTVMRTWKRKTTDAKCLMVLSISTGRWGYKSWTRPDSRVGSNWTWMLGAKKKLCGYIFMEGCEVMDVNSYGGNKLPSLSFPSLLGIWLQFTMMSWTSAISFHCEKWRWML